MAALNQSYDYFLGDAQTHPSSSPGTHEYLGWNLSCDGVHQRHLVIHTYDVGPLHYLDETACLCSRLSFSFKDCVLLVY